MNEYHIPVLLNRSVDALIAGNPGGVYADATFGGGGHSREILSRLAPEGRLIAFDKDEDAIRNRLDDERFTLIRNNFRFVHNFTLFEGYSEGIDGILADLGVSSHQFDTPERGFSFRFDATLDMRMNNLATKTAADIVNSYSVAELEKVLRLYGEVDGSFRIASLIEKFRNERSISTTGDLCAAIETAIPVQNRSKVLAKIFQALRIEVNGEMNDLENFLSGAASALKKGGRLVVITYHSLEDRMVKNFIRSGRIDGECVKDIYGKTDAPLEAVNRKPIEPDEEETSRNPRSRSAKMRVALKK